MVPVFAAGTPGTAHTDLILEGSTTLGPVMVQAQTAFNAASPGGVTIATITQDGSGAGMKALNPTTQKCDIAMSSLALKTDGSENDTPYPVPSDAVIFMVNDVNTPSCVKQLTKTQIYGIFEGAYADANGKEWWDSDAVTLSNGLVGDNGVTYEKGFIYPALPGNGVSGAHARLSLLPGSWIQGPGHSWVIPAVKARFHMEVVTLLNLVLTILQIEKKVLILMPRIILWKKLSWGLLTAVEPTITEILVPRALMQLLMFRPPSQRHQCCHRLCRIWIQL